MATPWYYRVDDEVRGPFSAQSLKRHVLRGSIQATTLVRRGEEGGWRAAEQIKGLLDIPEQKQDSLDDDEIDHWLTETDTEASPGDGANGTATDETADETASASDGDTTAAFAPPVKSRKRWALLAGVGTIALAGAAVVAVMLNNRSSAEQQSAGDDSAQQEIAALKQQLDNLKSTKSSKKASKEPVEPAAEGVPEIETPTVADNQPAAPSEPTPEATQRIRQAIVVLHGAGDNKSATADSTGIVVDPSGIVLASLRRMNRMRTGVAQLADGRKLPLQGWLAADASADLVLLKVKAAEPLVALPLAEKTPALQTPLFTLPADAAKSPGLGKLLLAGVKSGRDVPGADASPDSMWVETNTAIVKRSGWEALVDISGNLVAVAPASVEDGGDASATPAPQFALAALEVHRLMVSAAKLPESFASLPSNAGNLKPAAPTVDPAAEAKRVAAAAQEQARAAREKAREEAIKLIYDKRLALFERYNRAGDRVVKLEGELRDAKITLNRAAAAAAAASQNGANIRNDKDRLSRDLTSAKTDDARDRIRARMQSLDRELRRYRQIYEDADAERDTASRNVAGINSNIQRERNEQAGCRSDAARLEADWVALLDPFGKLEAGEHEKVVEIASQWILANNKNASAYLLRADAYLNTGKGPLAVTDMNRAVALEPQSPSTIAQRGWMHTRLGNTKQALADFGAAIKLDKKYVMAHLFKAQTLARTRQYQAASRDFQLALQLAPDQTEVLRAYAWFLATCPLDSYRKAPLAVKYGEQACKATNWKDAACLDSFAAAAAEKGDFASAVKWATAAADMAPKHTRDAVAARLKLYQAKKPFRDG